MSVDGVDSSPSLPPEPPPEPVSTGSEGAESASATSSTDSASSPEGVSSSSGSDGAAAPSAEFTRSWNADSFGAANNDGTQAAKTTGDTSALADTARADAARADEARADTARADAARDRNADGFEAAKGSGRPALDLTGAGGTPASALGGPNAGARGAQNPGGLAAAQGRPDNTLGGPPRPTPPQADPATRQRVETEITRRLGDQGGNARDIADRMARTLGNGDMRRGMDILERGLRNNNLNVGLAGINGAFGGPRTQATLDALQRDMRGATGRGLDTVIDNDNGARAANAGEHNPGQLTALRDVVNLGNQLGIRTDLVSHSNGFNTLRTFLGENPNARLGNVTLVNPNIPPAFADTQRGFQAMVNQSDRVRLITSIGDGVVPMSGAARNGNGAVWQQQINAAAGAGVQDITVLREAGHGVDAVAGQIGAANRPNLDFARDANGRTVPRDPAAWRQQGFTWSAQNGFRPVRQETPTLGGPQRDRPQARPQPQLRPQIPTLGGPRLDGPQPRPQPQLRPQIPTLGGPRSDAGQPPPQFRVIPGMGMAA
jgi:hypothetical protein